MDSSFNPEELTPEEHAELAKAIEESEVEYLLKMTQGTDDEVREWGYEEDEDSSEDDEPTPCRYGNECRKKGKGCWFSHPNEPIPCRYGVYCYHKNTSCKFSHPSITEVKVCRYSVGCTRPDCMFAHPDGRAPCRYGKECRNKGTPSCTLTHPK